MNASQSLAVVLFGISVIAAAPPSEAPRIMRAADPRTPFPIWVAADTALTAEGKLNTS